MNPTAGYYYCRGCGHKMWMPGRGCGTITGGWEYVRVYGTLHYEDAPFCNVCLRYRYDQEQQAKKENERRAEQLRKEAEQAKRAAALEAEVARLGEELKKVTPAAVTRPKPPSVRTAAPTPQTHLYLQYYYGPPRHCGG